MCYILNSGVILLEYVKISLQRESKGRDAEHAVNENDNSQAEKAEKVRNTMPYKPKGKVGFLTNRYQEFLKYI